MTIQRLYNTTIFVDSVPVGWAKSIDFSIDYNNQDEETHSGKIVRNSLSPGVEIEISKLSKFDPSSENDLLDAFDTLGLSGGTVTMITNEPGGNLIINAYDCRMDEEEWNNEAGEFFEMTFNLVGESFVRYFYED
ncbi:MAG: hypothetical protein LUC37_06595 [Prevotella sp.]|nr:hypothetical protein [Prevotella sp.]